MIQLGQYAHLQVLRKVDFGYYLDAENFGEILLPKRHAPNNTSAGGFVDVFIYLDSDDRPVATSQKPKACVGQFAYLKVKDTNPVGAFLDWGLDKDLLVPFAEQHRRMETGHAYLVYIYIDKIDSRITASSKIDKFVEDTAPPHFKSGQPVELIVANSTELGYKAIINHYCWGLLFQNEIHQRLHFGQSIQAYIKQIRPDGKIDLSLHTGQNNRQDDEEIILSNLKIHDGFLSLHDKSHPQEIAEMFGMSKGAFKKAIGSLYKKKIISIEATGIRLL